MASLRIQDKCPSEHWWHFSEPGCLVPPHYLPFHLSSTQRPLPARQYWSRGWGELDILQGWTGGGLPEPGPSTITSLDQRLSPLWPRDQTPCCPSILTQITALASTLFPQSIVTLDGGKLIHVQKWDGQETKLVRELVNGKLILVRRKTSEPFPVVTTAAPSAKHVVKSQGLPLAALEAGTVKGGEHVG